MHCPVLRIQDHWCIAGKAILDAAGMESYPQAPLDRCNTQWPTNTRIWRRALCRYHRLLPRQRFDLRIAIVSQAGYLTTASVVRGARRAHHAATFWFWWRSGGLCRLDCIDNDQLSATTCARQCQDTGRQKLDTCHGLVPRADADGALDQKFLEILHIIRCNSSR
jgi:hypothetical protein